MKINNRKKYRVEENNTTIWETDDYEDAVINMILAHKKDPSKFHEVHEFNVLGDGLYCGIRQLEPYDCPTCFMNPDHCKCEVKVKTPKGWMSHATWANNQTIEMYEKTFGE